MKMNESPLCKFIWINPHNMVLKWREINLRNNTFYNKIPFYKGQNMWFKLLKKGKEIIFKI